MKKSLSLLLLLSIVFTLLLGLASCVTPEEPAAPCAHVDLDDDELCDICFEPYSDGSEFVCQHIDVDDDELCDLCSAPYSDGDTILYVRNGEYILFGEYPQTLKTEDVTVDESVSDARGYFLGSDGKYYAKVTANPYETGYKFADGSSVSKGTTYYFRVDPIRWRILKEEGGAALLLCDSLLSNCAYAYNSNHNYKDSNVRAWLNGQFYESAFGELERKIINTTLVDNSAASTGVASSPYFCEDTEDKIFILSFVEATSSEFGFDRSEIAYDVARRFAPTDYAKAKGLLSFKSSQKEFAGNSTWWLRSPLFSSKTNARVVDYTGCTTAFDSKYSAIGVLPALWITLS